MVFFSFQKSLAKKNRIAKNPGKVIKVRAKRQSAKFLGSKRINNALRRFLANIRRWQSGRQESEGGEELHNRIEEVRDIEAMELDEPETSGVEMITDCGDNHN